MIAMSLLPSVFLMGFIRLLSESRDGFIYTKIIQFVDCQNIVIINKMIDLIIIKPIKFTSKSSSANLPFYNWAFERYFNSYPAFIVKNNFYPLIQIYQLFQKLTTYVYIQYLIMISQGNTLKAAKILDPYQHKLLDSGILNIKG
jgi:hypothetical protein